MTGTAGPDQTHVPLTAHAGLTRYDGSHADITALRPFSRARRLTRHGLLTSSELVRLARQLTVYLGIRPGKPRPASTDRP